MRDSDLDDLFATARSAARGTAQTVPADLMARVMADAEAVQRTADQPLAGRQRAAKPTGFWAGLVAAIGGGPALAGLSTATLAGLWIGFAQPVAITSVTDVFLASSAVTETLDVMPAFDDFQTEG